MEAWMLFDSSTPATMEMVRRLSEYCDRVPVGTLHFRSSDLLGRNILEPLQQDLQFVAGVKADITPGRKAQGYVLGLIPGIKLWSLRPDLGKAVALDGTELLPLRGSDIVTQARVRGGRLVEGEDVLAWNADDQGFWSMLGQFVAIKSRELQDRAANFSFVPLRNMRCAQGEVRLDDMMTTVVIGAKRSSLQLTREVIEGGFWFERVVARRFAEAGAEEVRINVKWAWPNDVQAYGHRDEVDVIARFGSSFFVISCKAGRRKRFKITTEAHNVEAVASRCIGRMAVPLLVLPIVSRELASETLGAEFGTAVLRPFDLLPESLRAKLDQIRAARRLLAE
jgi:Holliday junction resolvase